MFILEFESHRGDVVNIFAKKKEEKKGRLLRVLSVDRRKFDGSQRRKKKGLLSLSRIKLKSTNRSGEEREEAAM